MSAHRLRVGLAVSLLGIALSTGTAAAQVSGCSFSDCTPQGGEVTTTTTTEQPGGGVLGEGATAAAPGSVESSSATAPSGSLPLTGGDVAGLVLVGGAAVAAGALMVRRSRTQH